MWWEDYTEERKMWHPSLQRITRWSRSKSSSPCYKYNGKQADTGNNKRQHMLWSTSVGRKECCSSMLCISALNSSMKALSLAGTAAEEALAAGPANQTSGPVLIFSPMGKNNLYPMRIKLRDKTPHSPLWSSNCSILQKSQALQRCN